MNDRLYFNAELENKISFLLIKNLIVSTIVIVGILLRIYSDKLKHTSLLFTCLIPKDLIKDFQAINEKMASTVFNWRHLAVCELNRTLFKPFATRHR
ncbi:hypothetical protein P2W68_00700 [Chryseobacterium arthrosphaerae]|uniref:hypothetical protein n=1 Tax=Chryseobacterium arthrosphaerae TaxID=651561 RepID=UPI0023E0A866|nr:hypothetical protein [Chryseobacterium arthrosphaerae]WES98146.1 hypothetical protein P2W68_00700 [Chryseobacterium arthrosphaerae]